MNDIDKAINMCDEEKQMSIEQYRAIGDKLVSQLESKLNSIYKVPSTLQQYSDYSEKYSKQTEKARGELYRLYLKNNSISAKEYFNYQGKLNDILGKYINKMVHESKIEFPKSGQAWPITMRR